MPRRLVGISAVIVLLIAGILFFGLRAGAAAAAPSTAPTPRPAAKAAAGPNTSVSDFHDVAPSDWFYPYVALLAQRGALSGYADGTFRPGTLATRSQMAKLVVGALGLDLRAPDAGYADVPASSPFAVFVAAATAHNMVDRFACGGPGEPCDSARRPYYRPGAPITRAQVARMLVAGQGGAPIADGAATFADVPAGHPAYGWVERAARNQVLSGYACGGAGEPCDTQARSFFHPDAVSTRAQAAKMLASALTGGAPAPSPTPAPAGHLYGIFGQGATFANPDSGLLQQEYANGVRMRALEPEWNSLQPNGTGDWNSNAAAALQHKIDVFTALGPDVQIVLDLGLQYTPAWAGAVDPLRDQYGTVWDASNAGGGPNIYWSPTVRQYAATYIHQVLSRLDYHGRLAIVRVGMYGGELLFPQADHGTQPSSFWAYDANAQAQSPVPGWKPGDAHPNGEDQTFYLWYVDSLVRTFTWVLNQVRHDYSGLVAPVTPGLGITDHGVPTLLQDNFVVSGWCCAGTGNYWQRVFRALPSAAAGVINWCSSVGDGSGADDLSPDFGRWSSAHQMAVMAAQGGRAIMGENPGHNAYDTHGGANPRSTMQWDFATTRTYGYRGMFWVRESDWQDAGNATLGQYGQMIAQYQ